MDALSSALLSIRLTSPLVARVQLGANVSIAFSGSAPHPNATPFHFLISGRCRLKTADRVFQMSPGDMAILPRAPWHALETGSVDQSFEIIDVVRASGQPLWSPDQGLEGPLHLAIGTYPHDGIVLSGIFTFDVRHGHSVLQELPNVIYIPDVGQPLGGLMQAGAAFILNEQVLRPGFAATACRLLEMILTESLRTWAIGNHHPPGLLRAVMDKEMAPLVRAIYLNPGDSWSVGEMADRCNMSRSTLIRRIHDKLGTSPKSFVAKVRYEYAEWQLRYTRTSTAMIAEGAGYGSTFAFSRAFRSQSTLTPFEFRKTDRIHQELFGPSE